MVGAGEWRSVLRITLLGLGCLSLAILVLFLGYFIGRSGGFYDAEANGYAAQYRQTTDSRINDCFHKAGPAPEAARCVQEAIDTGHEDRRAEQNLTAQRDMANWAWWLLVVTIGQTPLTAVGIILLLWNIRQADAANEISRQAMTAENRAWIEIEIISLGDLIYKDGEFRLQVKFYLRNIGKSVALNAAPEAELLGEPLMGDRTIGEIPAGLREVYDRFKARPQKLMAQNIFPGRKSPLQDHTVAVQADKVELKVGGEGKNLFPLTLVLGVQYNTIFDRPDDDGHQTIEVASIRRMHNGQPGLIVVGRTTVPASELALVHSFENLGIVS